MAMDGFISCFSGKVGVTVDGLVTIGEDGLRTARDALKSLNAHDIAVISWLAGVSTAALRKILERIIGGALADLFIVFLGGVAWGILLTSFIECSDQFL